MEIVSTKKNLKRGYSIIEKLSAGDNFTESEDDSINNSNHDNDTEIEGDSINNDDTEDEAPNYAVYFEEDVSKNIDENDTEDEAPYDKDFVPNNKTSLSSKKTSLSSNKISSSSSTSTTTMSNIIGNENIDNNLIQSSPIEVFKHRAFLSMLAENNLAELTLRDDNTSSSSITASTGLMNNIGTNVSPSSSTTTSSTTAVRNINNINTLSSTTRSSVPSAMKSINDVARFPTVFRRIFTLDRNTSATTLNELCEMTGTYARPINQHVGNYVGKVFSNVPVHHTSSSLVTNSDLIGPTMRTDPMLKPFVTNIMDTSSIFGTNVFIRSYPAASEIGIATGLRMHFDQFERVGGRLNGRLTRKPDDRTYFIIQTKASVNSATREYVKIIFVGCWMYWADRDTFIKQEHGCPASDASYFTLMLTTIEPINLIVAELERTIDEILELLRNSDSTAASSNLSSSSSSSTTDLPLLEWDARDNFGSYYHSSIFTREDAKKGSDMVRDIRLKMKNPAIVKKFLPWEREVAAKLGALDECYRTGFKNFKEGLPLTPRQSNVVAASYKGWDTVRNALESRNLYISDEAFAEADPKNYAIYSKRKEGADFVSQIATLRAKDFMDYYYLADTLGDVNFSTLFPELYANYYELIRNKNYYWPGTLLARTPVESVSFDDRVNYCNLFPGSNFALQYLWEALDTGAFTINPDRSEPTYTTIYNWLITNHNLEDIEASHFARQMRAKLITHEDYGSIITCPECLQSVSRLNRPVALHLQYDPKKNQAYTEVCCARGMMPDGEKKHEPCHMIRVKPDDYNTTNALVAKAALESFSRRCGFVLEFVRNTRTAWDNAQESYLIELCTPGYNINDVVIEFNNQFSHLRRTKEIIQHKISDLRARKLIAPRIKRSKTGK